MGYTVSLGGQTVGFMLTLSSTADSLKMKWEVEKTWDLDLRLKRWSSNNFNTKPTAVFTSTVKIDHRNRQ